MVVSKEFRIGNLVQYDSRVFEIHSILEDVPLLNTSEFGVGVVDFEHLHYLPITRQELIRLGFIEYKNTFNFTIKIGDYFSCGNRKTSTLKIRLTGANNWNVTNFANKTIYLKHVHEVQNLYFAMTKNELNYETKS